LVALVSGNANLLPTIMIDNHYTGAMIFVVGPVWLLILAALIGAWRRRQRSVLDLWLMVAMCAWVFDVALSAVLNAGRFDLGFYMGRLSGLLASSVVLMVLMAHTVRLYSELAASASELKQSNDELDAFAYAVAHDLRAPLRAMSGFSQALVEDYGQTLTDEAKRFLDEIVNASHRMGALIDGILSLSRIIRGVPRRENIDISAIAARLARDLERAEPERRVSWSVEPGLNAMGDARMIEAALTNLIGNAWKYSSKVASPEVRVFSERRAGSLFICVADNGAGFDMAYAARLFKPFQRLHRQDEFPGIGIGLATVQRIVNRHGGTIDARGEPDKGATFSFSLPDGVKEASP